MAEIQDLSATDANNTARWPENMPFSGVNDAGRADEGILARWYKDTDGSLTSGGSSNAFTVTTNRTIAALFDNMVLVFTANFSITGACTLNVNGLGAKSIKRFNGNDLATGDIISGQPVIVVYKTGTTQFFMMSALAALTGQTFVDLGENASPGTPAADTARLYAFDDSGTTRLAYKDSAATVNVLYPIATQAEMETATATNRLVVPGRQHFHPGHSKAGGNFDGTGTPAFRSGDYGMGAITDLGTGHYTLALDTAFSNTNYWVVGCCRGGNAFGGTVLGPAGTGLDVQTTSSYITQTTIPTVGNFDTSEVGIAFFGDYA